jgi:putative acetyltransferase
MTLKLRPYRATDASALRELFAQSIDVLCAEDYDEDQRIAWIGAAENLGRFGARLAAAVTLVVDVDGAPQGFASLKGVGTINDNSGPHDNSSPNVSAARDNPVIDMLYVHPDAAGKGVGRMLLETIEQRATVAGAPAITVDASDTASPFFAKFGYVPMQRKLVTIDDIWLAHTTMTKKF